MKSAWPNLSDLIAPKDSDAPVGVLGAPLNMGSVTPGRCDLAPKTLHATLPRIGLYDVETGKEISTRIAAHGVVPVVDVRIEDATGPIIEAAAECVKRRELTLLIGGNNAVTRPAALAVAQALDLPLDRIGLITLDAHFDMRDLTRGLGNGNPVRALREDGLPGRNVAQIGLASFANSADMHRDAMAGGHLVVTMEQVRSEGIARAIQAALAHVDHCDAIVVDCDIDVIDRSQFPGAPGARPGGMAVNDFFAGVRALAKSAKVRLIDLTEWDPPLDSTDLSALTAARWLAECLAGYELR